MPPGKAKLDDVTERAIDGWRTSGDRYGNIAALIAEKIPRGHAETETRDICFEDNGDPEYRQDDCR
jgi:hypothetical protein